MKTNQTKSIGTSMFSVRCWMLNVAVFATAASALADVHYVDVNSTNATPPYSSWSTAATNIQAALDAAVAGDEIVVTNGSYATGGRAIGGDSTFNRVAVDKPLSVRSVNGPQSTTIDGGNFVRCVYLTNGTALSGFTLTHGYAKYGAGVFCQSQTAVVSNCVVSGNLAQDYDGSYYLDAYGGGAYGGTLNNCTLTGNSATGGGDSPDTRAYGGGAYHCTLNNCTLRGNSVRYDPRSITARCGDHISGGSVQGGGAYYCTLNNCTLTGNSATGYSYSWQGLCGGRYDSISISITAYGGGAAVSPLNNCISFGNYYRVVHYPGPVYFDICEDCVSPGHLAGNTWRGDPLFVDTNGWANLRLQSNSPCINAGNNSYVTNATDFDGNPRIVGGSVDMGAYEFQAPASMISYAWLQQFNLPINPATDTADPDGDGVNNYREWLAGSDPTNPYSFPPLLTLIPYGANVILTWPTNAFGFTLQSTTNLGSPAVWSTNSPGPVVLGGQNTVTNPITGPQQFFRLRQ